MLLLHSKFWSKLAIRWLQIDCSIAQPLQILFPLLSNQHCQLNLKEIYVSFHLIRIIRLKKIMRIWLLSYSPFHHLILRSTLGSRVQFSYLSSFHEIFLESIEKSDALEVASICVFDFWKGCIMVGREIASIMCCIWTSKHSRGIFFAHSQDSFLRSFLSHRNSY